MNLIDTILRKMSTISTPQRKFVTTLLTTIHLLRGRMTFLVLTDSVFSGSNRNS